MLENQATMLTNGVEQGRHLLNGTLNNLAQELEEMSQAQVCRVESKSYYAALCFCIATPKSKLKPPSHPLTTLNPTTTTTHRYPHEHTRL